MSLGKKTQITKERKKKKIAVMSVECWNLGESKIGAIVSFYFTILESIKKPNRIERFYKLNRCWITDKANHSTFSSKWFHFFFFSFFNVGLGFDFRPNWAFSLFVCNFLFYFDFCFDQSIFVFFKLNFDIFSFLIPKLGNFVLFHFF